MANFRWSVALAKSPWIYIPLWSCFKPMSKVLLFEIIPSIFRWPLPKNKFWSEDREKFPFTKQCGRILSNTFPTPPTEKFSIVELILFGETNSWTLPVSFLSAISRETLYSFLLKFARTSLILIKLFLFLKLPKICNVLSE